MGGFIISCSVSISEFLKNGQATWVGTAGLSVRRHPCHLRSTLLHHLLDSLRHYIVSTSEKEPVGNEEARQAKPIIVAGKDVNGTGCFAGIGYQAQSLRDISF